eukprot:g16127.t1
MMDASLDRHLHAILISNFCPSIMEGGVRTPFLKLVLICACALNVVAKQFYFVSFDGSNNQNHGEVRDTGTKWDEDYYPNGLCRPKKDWSSYCTDGYSTNDECKLLCDFNQYPDGAAYYLIDNGAASPFLYKALGSSSNLALGRQDSVSQGHTMDGKNGDIETCSIADPDTHNPWWMIDLGISRQIGKLKIVSSKFFLLDNFEVYGSDVPLGTNEIDGDLEFSRAYMCSNQTSIDYQDDGKISQNFASDLNTLRPTFLLPCSMIKRYVYIRINTRAANKLAVFSLCEGRFFYNSNSFVASNTVYTPP